MKINFESISGHGFMTFRDPFVLPLMLFNGQAVFVQGENRDEPMALSNGSGKSNLLEALTFGLFGKISKRLRILDEIINLECDECVVRVVFSVGADRFEIIRKRHRGKPTLNGIEIKRNGNTELEDSDNATKQTHIEHILGLSFVTYSHSVMFCQRFTAFPELKAPQRAALLSELSGADIYLKAQAVAKRNLETIQSELSSLEVNKRAIEALIQELSRINYDTEIEKFERNKTSTLARLEKESQELTQAIEAYWNKKGESVESLESQISALDKKLSGLKDEFESFKGIQRLKEKKEAEANVTQQQINSLTSNMEAKQREIERLKKENTGNCPYCGQSLDSTSIGTHIQEIEQDLSMTAKDMMVLQVLLKDEKKEIESLRKDNAAYVALSITITQTTNEQSKLKKKLALLNSDSEVVVLKTKHERCLEDIEETKSLTHQFGSLKQQQQEQLDNADKQLQEHELQIQELKNNKLPYMLFWVENFPRLRIMMLDEVAIRLEELTQDYLSRYCSELTTQIHTERTTQSGNVRDEIAIMVNTPKGTVSYEGYGGGETQKIRMAISLALSKLISERSGRDYNLVCFDEPNVGLDRVGRDANATVFQDLPSQEGKTVLVIEHDDHIQDYMNETITVIRENHKSVIQGL